MKQSTDFIAGEFIDHARPTEEWQIHSPADLADPIGEFAGSMDHVDRAVDVARAAFLPWARRSYAERKEHLFKLRSRFVARADEFTEVISRETGKPAWEAKGEAQAIINKIDITLEHSLKLVADERISDALPGVEGLTRFKPRGVMAVIGPFNFPAHLPNGHIIPALVTGNTVIFKPSDKTPLTGHLMARCFAESEFPAGVFNLVHGRADIGRHLAIHAGVDGVLFTGSYDVGLTIKRDTVAQSHKLLALEMGGKNQTVVWHDADFDKALYESLVGSFLSAGQRCSNTSRIIVHRSRRDEFIERFTRGARDLKVGHWRDPVFMGPVISAEAQNRFLKFQKIAAAEGAKSVLAGRALDLNPRGHFVSPSVHQVESFNANSTYQGTEIFGPDVAIYAVDDIEEAIAINNQSGFGLVMSLFTKNRALYEKALLEARVGVLNLNRATNGASSRLPFGGMNRSGNDRPSAHFAVNYCTVPVASLDDPTPFTGRSEPPGMNFQTKRRGTDGV